MKKKKKQEPVALITGGAKRLGAKIALRVAQLGYHIVLHYHTSEKEAKEVAKQIEALGKSCFLIQADLSNLEAVEAFFQKATEEAPSLSLLINNAAGFFPDNRKKMAPHFFEKQVHLNALAPILLMQKMIALNPYAHIINLLDSRIYSFDQNYLSYSLSKKFLYEATLHFAQVAPKTARINAIAPKAILAPPETQRDLTISKNKKLKGIDRSEQLLKAVEFLIENDYVKTEVLLLGGLS